MKKRVSDLTGMRFGRLVVLENTGTKGPKNNSYLWRCQCDCGNICLKPTNELNAGFATSCGCAVATRNISIGQRFGRLTTIEPTDKRRNKCVVWRCKCDCGNEVEVRSALLQNGHVTSCGCLRAELDKLKPMKNMTYVDGTCIEFIRNIDVPTKANTTGVRGVVKMKNGRYKAGLTFQKTYHYLGTFETLEEAAEARRNGEVMVRDYLKNYHETKANEETKTAETSEVKTVEPEEFTDAANNIE